MRFPGVCWGGKAFLALAPWESGLADWISSENTAKRGPVAVHRALGGGAGSPVSGASERVPLARSSATQGAE